MGKDEMRDLSDEELLEISKRKTKKGTYSREANAAMDIRRERSGNWTDVPRIAPGNRALDARYEGITDSDWWE